MMSRSPRQNRVTPFGDLEAVEARGLLFGNRGCLHDEHGRIVRHSANARWIICLLEFKGRRRSLMQPGRYTELFFLDEATALAAGHRPCAECRRADYNAFRHAIAESESATELVGATALDARLARERAVDGAARPSWLPRDLPEGAMVLVDRAAHLWWRDQLLPWSHEGYGPPFEAERGLLVVLTPTTTLAALRGGYRPMVHPVGTT
jgi:hypothetical protein